MMNNILDLDLGSFDSDDEEDESLEYKFLIFSLDSRDYGISVGYVTEIIGLQEISEIPEVPDYIRGVMTLRNRVIPILDIRKRFSLDHKEDNERTCLVVLQIKDISLALVVDAVKEVLTVDPAAIEPAPQFGEADSDRFISSLVKIQGRVKILIDVNKLLRDDELEKINKITNI